MKRLGDISCRSVGPGGTTVTFYATPKGIVAVWDNENCPYTSDGKYGGRVVTADEHNVASDGHNVSMIEWSEVKQWAAAAPKEQK